MQPLQLHNLRSHAHDSVRRRLSSRLRLEAKEGGQQVPASEVLQGTKHQGVPEEEHQIRVDSGQSDAVSCDVPTHLVVAQLLRVSLARVSVLEHHSKGLHDSALRCLPDFSGSLMWSIVLPIDFLPEVQKGHAGDEGLALHSHDKLGSHRRSDSNPFHSR